MGGLKMGRQDILASETLNETLDTVLVPGDVIRSGKRPIGGRYAVNMFAISDGYIVFYVVCAICVAMVILYNMHVIYFTIRYKIQLTANDRYLTCLIITHAALAVTVLVKSVLVKTVDRQIMSVLSVPGITGALYMSTQGSMLALLIDRHLFINRGILYDCYIQARLSKFIVGIILLLSSLTSLFVNLPYWPIIRRIYIYTSITISVIIFGFNFYKNIKIYQITSKALTEQHKIDFAKTRGRKLLVVFFDVMMTLIQMYVPVVRILVLLQKEYRIRIYGNAIRSYLRDSPAFVMGIYVTWYIITDKKWRLLYQKYGVFAMLRRKSSTSNLQAN
jgi:hypothetical protein